MIEAMAGNCGDSAGNGVLPAWAACPETPCPLGVVWLPARSLPDRCHTCCLMNQASTRTKIMAAAANAHRTGKAGKDLVCRLLLETKKRVIKDLANASFFW